MDNAEVADRLNEVADLLEAQDANAFRVRAYRSAATTAKYLDEPASEIYRRGGLAGLTNLPGIGKTLGRAIEEILTTGRLSLLDRLRGEAGPEMLLASVPGIGPELAHRIHDCLSIETLEDLEQAAHDGRLDQVPGIGPKKVRAVRESLAGRLGRGRRPPVKSGGLPRPPVAELLDVDEEYRRKVEANELPRIAPRRFNPEGRRWLPILHTQRGRRTYTALFSNTALAHELGRTHDWVVIYWDDDESHGQWTVVTPRTGRLRGRRVVRGREAECAEHYEQTAKTPAEV